MFFQSECLDFQTSIKRTCSERGDSWQVLIEVDFGDALTSLWSVFLNLCAACFLVILNLTQCKMLNHEKVIIINRIVNVRSITSVKLYSGNFYCSEIRIYLVR